jgi:hypothetical protein
LVWRPWVVFVIHFDVRVRAGDISRLGLIVSVAYMPASREIKSRLIRDTATRIR